MARNHHLEPTTPATTANSAEAPHAQQATYPTILPSGNPGTKRAAKGNALRKMLSNQLASDFLVAN